MSKDQQVAEQRSDANIGSVGVYVTGFVLSLALTLVAYLLVSRHESSHHLAIPHGLLIGLVTGLAVTQLLVQLIFFLHMDNESKPRWNLTVLLFAVLVLVIVVFGSLWIMNNLDYHMSDPHQINEYLRHQNDL